MTDGERRAWAWVAALRAGTTTPWAGWAGEGDRSDRALPGAQQLELLRRLNVAGRPDSTLVDRVLTASAPGRGRPDLELVGSTAPSRWGPPPVDPADLPDDELLRVASNLLAEDVVAEGTPPTPTPRLYRPWRPYRLVGVPWLADPLRGELIRRGRRPGGRGAIVHVVGSDLATMIALAWTARSFDEGSVPWADWKTGAVSSRRVPPRADLAAVAATWARRVGKQRVRVVLDLGALPRSLGVRGRLPEPVVPSADATDLARRVGAPLGLLVLPERRAALLRHTLLPRLLDDPGPPLALGTADLATVRERAERMRRSIEEAGYAVLGAPARLVPAAVAGDGDGTGHGTGPDDARVLDLAIRLLLEKEGRGR